MAFWGVLWYYLKLLCGKNTQNKKLGFIKLGVSWAERDIFFTTWAVEKELFVGPK